MPLNLSEMDALINDNTSGDISAAEVRAVTEGLFQQIYYLEPGLKPPDTEDAADIEFSDFANGDDATDLAMTWGNQGSATAEVRSGRLILNSATTTGLRGLFIATPGSGNFTVATRINVASWSNYQFSGLCFVWGTPGSPTQAEGAGMYARTSDFQMVNWSAHGSDWTADSDRLVTDPGVMPPRMYLLVAWDGTNLAYSISPSGIVGTFEPMYSGALGFGRPDYVGLAVNTNGAAKPVRGEFPFLRFNWPGSDLDLA